jgi:hypothetical protein
MLNKHYKNYKKLHKNTLNRIFHVVSLFVIPYSVYLLFKKEYFKSLIYYVIFIHSIPWFIGHFLIEKNHLSVVNRGKRVNLDTLFFFTIYTPILRAIDAYYLCMSVKNKNKNVS